MPATLKKKKEKRNLTCPSFLCRLAALFLPHKHSSGASPPTQPFVWSASTSHMERKLWNPMIRDNLAVVSVGGLHQKRLLSAAPFWPLTNSYHSPHFILHGLPCINVSVSLPPSFFCLVPTCLPLREARLKNRKLRQIAPHNVTINADVHVRSEPDDKRTAGNCFLHMHRSKPSTLCLFSF